MPEEVVEVVESESDGVLVRDKRKHASTGQAVPMRLAVPGSWE